MDARFKASGRAQGWPWLAASKVLSNLCAKGVSMIPEEKGLNRGGAGGQAGELNDGRWREPPADNPDRNQRKPPQGGLSRDPALNPNSQRPEKHISD
jgi:hypothetical protein